MSSSIIDGGGSTFLDAPPKLLLPLAVLALELEERHPGVDSLIVLL
jgi:hypothetical protein